MMVKVTVSKKWRIFEITKRVVRQRNLSKNSKRKEENVEVENVRFRLASLNRFFVRKKHWKLSRHRWIFFSFSLNYCCLRHSDDAQVCVCWFTLLMANMKMLNLHSLFGLDLSCFSTFFLTLAFSRTNEILLNHNNDKSDVVLSIYRQQFNFVLAFLKFAVVLNFSVFRFDLSDAQFLWFHWFALLNFAHTQINFRRIFLLSRISNFTKWTLIDSLPIDSNRKINLIVSLFRLSLFVKWNHLFVYSLSFSIFLILSLAAADFIYRRSSIIYLPSEYIFTSIFVSLFSVTLRSVFALGTECIVVKSFSLSIHHRRWHISMFTQPFYQSYL